MNSSRPPDQPLSNGAGIETPRIPEDDPYRALDELMAVIEILCPEWPERGTFVDSGKMLL